MSNQGTALAAEVDIPASCRPGWRSLPALAWTMARAFSAGPTAIATAEAACSFPVFLATLAGAQAAGEVASLDRHAVLILRFAGRRRRLRRRAITTAVILSEMALLAAVLVPASEAVAMAAAVATKSTIVGLLVAVATATPAVLCAVPAARTLPAVARARAHERNAKLNGFDPRHAIRAEIFGAWPIRRGHGTRLVTHLLTARAIGQQPVWATARTTELAEVYNRWGLPPHSPGSVVVHNRTPESTGGQDR